MNEDENGKGQPVINWNWAMLQRFRKAVKAARPGTTFQFEGHEYVYEYAKYLIEYLESRLQRPQ